MKSGVLRNWGLTLLIACGFINLTLAQEPIIPGQPYFIEVMSSGKLVDVAGYSTENGGPIHMWERHGQTNQQFVFQPTQYENYYTIVSVHSGKALDIPGASNADGVGVIQYDRHDSSNQLFQLVHAAGTDDKYYYLINLNSGKALEADPGSHNGALLRQKTNQGIQNQMFKFIPVNNTGNQPAKPVLVSPVNGQVLAHGSGVDWVFNWQEVPGASRYQLLVEHSNGQDVFFNGIVFGTTFATTLSAPITDHLSNDAWSWWVRAEVGNEWGEWSTNNYFYVENNATSVPSLQYPTANAQLPNGILDSNTEYTWEFSWNTVSGVPAYQIQIRDNLQQLWHSNTIGYTPYSIPLYSAILPEHLNGWSWRVCNFNNNVVGECSAYNWFTVASPGIDIQPPVLSTPQNYAALDNDEDEGLNWTFSWEYVPNANRYQIDIMQAGEIYDQAFIDGNQSYYTYINTEIVINERYLNDWTWRVRAERNGIWSDWSEIRNFTVHSVDYEAPLINNFGNSFYRIKSGYTNAFLGAWEECYSGMDLTCYGFNLVINQLEYDELLEFQFEGLSSEEEIYGIKAFYRDNNNQRRELGYLNNTLKFSDGSESGYATWKWIIEPHPSGYFYIRLYNSNLVLELKDTSYSERNFEMTLENMTGNQRQLFNLMRN